MNEDIRYTVTSTIKAGDNDPVDVRWGTNVNAATAMSCVAQIIAQGHDEDTTVPESVRPKLLAITVFVE